MYPQSVYESLLVGQCKKYPYKLIKTGPTGVKCVLISSTQASWSSAKQKCENDGSYLVTFASRNESVGLMEHIHDRGMSVVYLMCNQGPRCSLHYYS